MEINEILVQLRKENGLTQKQLAGILQMSETGYASWEQGLAEPSISAIKKLCSFFDVSADYLLGINDNNMF